MIRSRRPGGGNEAAVTGCGRNGRGFVTLTVATGWCADTGCRFSRKFDFSDALWAIRFSLLCSSDKRAWIISGLLFNAS